MSVTRLSGVVLVLLSTVSLAAQETTAATDALAHWSAPPYWSGPQSPVKDVGQMLDGRAEPGVQPLGDDDPPVAAPLPLPLTAVTPCRVVDTRGASGPFGGPALAANAARTFTVPSGPCPGLPLDAAAWSLNFTVIAGSGTFQSAFLTVWATGLPQPLVSTLNFNANQLVSNAAVVPAGTSGAIQVFVNAPAHVLIDINGYYRAGGVVNALNGLSGFMALLAGENITITPSGQTLTIHANVVQSKIPGGRETNSSDRGAESNVEPVDRQEVLTRLVQEVQELRKRLAALERARN